MEGKEIESSNIWHALKAIGAPAFEKYLSGEERIGLAELVQGK